MDYLKYKFYELDDSKRNKYIMRRQYADLCMQYSTEEARKNITDKCCFAKKYISCLEREILIEDKKDFWSKYTWMCHTFPYLIYKPVSGGYGREIRVFSTHDLDACEQVWQAFIKGEGMIEEFISQHPGEGLKRKYS